MQSLEYEEGYQAYLDGENRAYNPYVHGVESADPDKYEDWESGWFDAQEKED